MAEKDSSGFSWFLINLFYLIGISNDIKSLSFFFFSDEEQP